MALVRVVYILLVALFTQAFAYASEISVPVFLVPSLLMGIGVGMDVLLATIAKFNDDNLSWSSWTVPVTITHILFPATGYLLFWYTATVLPALQTILGITGFILVSLFIYEIICDAIDRKPIFGISTFVGKLFGFNTTSARTFVAVIAVSWDALWSGPAKASQALSGGWSGAEVVLSFIVAGLTVAIIAELALFAAKLLRRRSFHNTKSFSEFSIFGLYLELSVIYSFGILSLWHAFSDLANIYWSLSISFVVILIIFLLNLKKLRETQEAESQSILN